MSTDSINCSNCSGGIRYDEDEDEDDDDDDVDDWSLEEVNGAFPLSLFSATAFVLEDCIVDSVRRGVC